MTRGPFGRLPKSLCDFGDMAPHTLVGGAQTTLTATASARADRRDCPSEAWGEWPLWGRNDGPCGPRAPAQRVQGRGMGFPSRGAESGVGKAKGLQRPV